ncbi:hypothetical protein ABH923_002779 [Leifsonia sp. EB41]|uniref:hypothetical protein n=1 Tax=Leifsonia sp. EB41 TaxID=3156260 RepID=UPI0035137685
MVDSQTAAWFLVSVVSIAALVAYILERPKGSRRTDHALSEKGAGVPIARDAEQGTDMSEATDQEAED